jgi:4-hydroxybenzoate-CoA ligase
VALLKNREMPNHRIRLCISAGEALPADIGRRWQDLFANEILDGVGSTEMLHIFLSNRAGKVNYGTSGIAVPGYELRCINEGGDQIQPGEVGEMLVKGGSSADGYWNQRAKNQATFEGEWTRTGDKYEIMADGTYIYCGRTDDMFKVSGIWLSPFEVEQTLISHTKVLEAAVVAQVDDHGLEKPKAFVVLNNNTPKKNIENELRDFVKERIGKWKYPRWIEVVDDLPKTATGKIQRFKLRTSK